MDSTQAQANSRQIVRAQRTKEKRPKYLSQRFPPSMVLQAIRLCGGSDLDMAYAMGCTPRTVRRIIAFARVSRRHAWARVVKEYDEDHLADLSKSNLRESLNPHTNPDLDSRVRDSKWYLERRDRNFTPKQTNTIEGGEKPVQTINFNLNAVLANTTPEVARQVLEAIDAQEERVRKAELRPVDGVVVESPKPVKPKGKAKK